MKEKLIKASSVVEIIKKYSIEAATHWEVGALVTCGNILTEIEALPGEDYAADTQAQKDQL